MISLPMAVKRIAHVPIGALGQIIPTAPELPMHSFQDFYAPVLGRDFIGRGLGMESRLKIFSPAYGGPRKALPGGLCPPSPSPSSSRHSSTGHSSSTRAGLISGGIDGRFRWRNMSITTKPATRYDYHPD
jgi:hypothetical protein